VGGVTRRSGAISKPGMLIIALYAIDAIADLLERFANGPSLRYFPRHCKTDR
jgi:hypothetical protein